MSTIGPLELLLIVIALALVFGVGRLAEFLKEAGKGIREFREETSINSDDSPAVEVTPEKHLEDLIPETVIAHPPPFTPLDDAPLTPPPPIEFVPPLVQPAIANSPIEVEGNISGKGIVVGHHNRLYLIENYNSPLDLTAFVEAPINVFVSAPEMAEVREIAKRAINSLAGLSCAWVLDALPPPLRESTVVHSYIEKSDIFIAIVEGGLGESQAQEIEIAQKMKKKNIFCFEKQELLQANHQQKIRGLVPHPYKNSGELEESIKKTIITLLLQSVRQDENRFNLNKPDIILLVTLAIAGGLTVKEEVWGNVRGVLKEFYQANLDDEVDTIKRVRDFAYSQIKKAEALFEKKEYLEVIKICGEVLTSNPHHVAALELRGIAYFRSYYYEKALSDLSQIINTTSDFSDEVIRYRGLSNYHLAKYKATIEDMTLLIMRERELVIAYAYRGSAWRYLKEYEQALEDINKALELDSAFEFALKERLRIYKDTEDKTQYLLEIEKTLKLNLMDSDFFARIVSLDGDLQLQLKLCDLIIGYFPNLALFYVMRANIYRKLKKYSQAINELNIATQIEPQNTNYYFDRVSIYMEVERYSFAINELDKILQIDPDNSWALTQKIDIYQEKIQDYRKLLLCVKQYLKQMDISTRYVISVGDKLIKKEKFSQSVELFTLVLNSSKTIRTERGEALAHRGRCYRRLNDLKRALIDLDEALKIDANSEYALQSRALVYWKIGKYNEALKDLEKVKKVAPSINKTTNEWIRGIVRDARRNNKRH